MPVVEPEVTWETLAKKPGGDRDTPFTWGHPRSCLTVMMQARLLMMRGFVQDHRAGVRGGAMEGDDDYVVTTPSGLYVPNSDYLKE